ncbi:DUF6538 domain-containing protein [Microvirga massiliensis]|uniref:DUF6538 domain-containing protein n=1 Tax=Microvirga massiliensis TaxID=1033741 RepID=UPI00062B4ED8|nr:DUF6538 domain-containing protein [Microvirga massiliensis]
MPVVANVERRGAVYYWRRRVPPSLARLLGRSHLKLSLRTKEPARARFLAAHLDATSENLFMSANLAGITKEQLADFGRQEPDFDSDVEAAGERAMGLAPRLLAGRGLSASLSVADRGFLLQQGHDAATVRAVEQVLQASGQAKPSQVWLRELVEGAAPRQVPPIWRKHSRSICTPLARLFSEPGPVPRGPLAVR